MSSYREIKAECYEANLLLPEYRLVDLTFGNVSVADRARGVFAIKPSGVDYHQLKPEDMIVLDFEGRTVEGSLRRDGTLFTGWGRSSTDPTGHWWFSTVEPGATTPGRPAFFAVTVFARGLLTRLFTRIYLPGQDDALAADPLLASLPAEDRVRLIAVRDGATSLRFDIHLQGPEETPFLTFPRHRD